MVILFVILLIILIVLALKILEYILENESNDIPSLLITPNIIEYNITNEDIEKELVRTIIITNIAAKEPRNIKIYINGIQETKAFSGYIRNRVAIINIKSLTDRIKIGDLLRNSSSSLGLMNIKILEINKMIYNYNCSLNSDPNSIKTEISKIRRIDIHIKNLDTMIKIINDLPDGALSSNTETIDFLNNIKNQINLIQIKLSELVEKEEISEPINSLIPIIFSISEKEFTLDGGETKFITLKLIVLNELSSGEYKGEVLIDDALKKPRTIPISINSACGGNKSETDQSNSKTEKQQSETESAIKPGEPEKIND